MTLNSQIVCFIGLMVLSSTLAQFTQSPPEKGVDHCKKCGIYTDTSLTPDEISVCNVVVPDVANPDNSEIQCECRKPHFEGDGLVCNNVDECVKGIDNCDNHAICFDTEKSFTCECNPGWTGDGITCTDIDECASTPTPCGDGGSCTNTVGSYTCSCFQDLDKASDYKFYRANFDASACEDVDECLEGAHDCGELCVNTDGGYNCSCYDVTNCSCKAGYTGDGSFCSNIDECQNLADNCDGNALCVDTDGQFTCSCRPGFTGDGVVCVDIDECKLNPCRRGKCYNVIGSYICFT